MSATSESLDLNAIGKLVDAAGTHPFNGVRNLMLVQLMYGHALRLVEAVNLRWKQFDMFYGRIKLERKSGTVVRNLTKLEMDSLRDLKLHDEGLGSSGPDDHVFVSSTGEPLTPDGIRKIITKAAKKAKLQGPVNPRMLRRSAGMRVGKTTGNLEAVQSVMGVKRRASVVSLMPVRKPGNQLNPWK